MVASQALTEFVQAELEQRYHYLCRLYGDARVCRPSAALVAAFAETTEGVRQGPEEVAMDGVVYAGDLYEYLVRCWQDPRWRMIVSIAIKMGITEGRHPGAGVTPVRQAGARFKKEPLEGGEG